MPKDYTDAKPRAVKLHDPRIRTCDWGL